MARKVSQREWEFEVKRALKVREVQKEQMKKDKFVYYKKVLAKFMPIPYILGFAAALALFLFYGWKEFIKFALSWIVSMTIVATVAYYLWKHYEKKL